MADLITTEIFTVGGRPDIDSDLVSASSGGDTAQVGRGLFLFAVNGSSVGSSRTITITTQRTLNGHAVADATMVIEHLDRGIIPLTTTLFRGPRSRARITYSGSEGLRVGVFRLRE
ncbi:hypothetical protein [Nocardiopsis quinghaiensis]|uniref:hypothetical protein n=1 Tax=Nocardiopsis quinghaiensis TaxID=464995 RepID=UPI0012388D79|nr:hypothetical protein [Nocardiopsis quinghaiensis]